MSNGLKILIGVLTAVSVTIGIILGVRQLLPDPVPPRHSVLILVDTSRSMNEAFAGSQTKLQAVREQILHFARSQPNTAIALRLTGGICNTEGYHPPPVTFHQENSSEIEAALADETASGDSDFATAVGEAVNDFDRYEAGRTAKVQSLWAFLGSGHDTCTTNAINEIRTALEGFDNRDKVQFDFFGVGASPSEDNRLRRLVRSLKNDGYDADIKTPNNLPQLRTSVEETSRQESPSE